MLESIGVVFFIMIIMGFWGRFIFFLIAYLAQVIICRLTAIGRERSVSVSDFRCANLLHLISTTVQMSRY